MTLPRVAVVASRYGDPWDEMSVLAARVGGALACAADVDVLVPSGSATTETGWDGACRVLRFPAAATDRRRARAWQQATHSRPDHGSGECSCPTVSTSRPLLPPFVQEQLLIAQGGDSPHLYGHLAESRYDATVFIGLQTPVTAFGVPVLPDDRRIFVVAGRWEPSLTPAFDSPILDRAQRIFAVTEGEHRRLAGELGLSAAEQIGTLGFLLGVNAGVRPAGTESKSDPFVVIARDWRTSESRLRYRPWITALARRFQAGMQVRAVGPGAASLPFGVPNTEARIDAWWWMSRAVAVLDPQPHRLLGQEELEAFFLGVPVVVAATGGAAREHAEAGNGGLWIRVDEEVIASVERLRDPAVARSLGEQGRGYATDRFGDTDTYVKGVVEMILG